MEIFLGKVIVSKHFLERSLPLKQMAKFKFSWDPL